MEIQPDKKINRFSSVLDELNVVKGTISSEHVEKEYNDICVETNNGDLYSFIMNMHTCVFNMYVAHGILKEVNSSNYKKLKNHSVYNTSMLYTGYVLSLKLGRKIARPLREVALDILCNIHILKFDTTISDIRLYTVLCIVAYLSATLDEFNIGFIQSALSACYYNEQCTAFIKRYMETDDLEYFDMANILTNARMMNIDSFVDKLIASYKTDKMYKDIPPYNLFKLCSYDRTPDDGYNVKCFNRSYQLATIKAKTKMKTEEMIIDDGYRSLGFLISDIPEIYSQLLINFHQHIYEKEIDVEILHKHIMIDDNLTPFERRLAIVFHRGIIKYYIHRGGIGKMGCDNTISFKLIAPNALEKGIVIFEESRY